MSSPGEWFGFALTGPLLFTTSSFRALDGAFTPCILRPDRWHLRVGPRKRHLLGGPAVWWLQDRLIIQSPSLQFSS
jgi:hypothetical protein